MVFELNVASLLYFKVPFIIVLDAIFISLALMVISPFMVSASILIVFPARNEFPDKLALIVKVFPAANKSRPIDDCLPIFMAFPATKISLSIVLLMFMTLPATSKYSLVP